MRFPNFSYERELEKKGFLCVAGVDEAGTGALAGPVVAGAAIVPKKSRIGILRDSKLLSSDQREHIFHLLKERGVLYSHGIVTIDEVNSMNIRQAALLAMERAVRSLSLQPDALLIDAFRIPQLHISQFPIIRGDRISKSISAASVVAKVTRDAMMNDAHVLFPEYGFAQHKGYGTSKHVNALREFGVSPLHRIHFAPVRQFIHV